jgi:RNA polymerase sigma-70 factor, ECF subfamily
MDPSNLTANDLAKLCSQSGTIEAWNEFVRRFQRPIARTVLRTARGWGEPSTLLVDDLVQETFLRLCADNCRLLRGFVSRQPDSILGYVNVIAANVTHDHFRAQSSLKRGGDLQRIESESDETESLPAPQSQIDTLQRNLQMAEIAHMLWSLVPETVPERDVTIFWLYYRQGYTAHEISRFPTFGLTVKGVETSIYRTTGLVRQAVLGKGIYEASTINREGR